MERVLTRGPFVLDKPGFGGPWPASVKLLDEAEIPMLCRHMDGAKAFLSYQAGRQQSWDVQGQVANGETKKSQLEHGKTACQLVAARPTPHVNMLPSSPGSTFMVASTGLPKHNFQDMCHLGKCILNPVLSRC